MFNAGDKVVAVREIKTKYHGLDWIAPGTEGIIHWYDTMRSEAAVLFVGHLMAYRIKAEDIKHFGS